MPSTRPPAEPALTVGAVILAAGRSARMGRPKLLLPWGHTSVLGHLVRQWRALGAVQIAVVHAPNQHALSWELDRLRFPAANRIPNPSPGRGMFSSIQCAAQWPGWLPSLTHWVLVLGDQPHLQPQTLRRLLRFAARHRTKICQPARRGQGRHPVILPRKMFDQLAATTAATLKEFLAARTRRIALCELNDPGLDLDIDRPKDYQRALMLGRP